MTRKIIKLSVIGVAGLLIFSAGATIARAQTRVSIGVTETIETYNHTAIASRSFTEFTARSPGPFALTILIRETSKDDWRSVGKSKIQPRGFFI